MTEYLSNMTLFDWIGILGSLVICIAYWMVSGGKVAADDKSFHVANLIGASMLLISLYFRPNPGAILIELIWAAIAGYSLLQRGPSDIAGSKKEGA